jgi:hypothetical protein
MFTFWLNNKTNVNIVLMKRCALLMFLKCYLHCYEVSTISSFWYYFYGNSFILVTNHQPFKFFMESNQFIGKLAKWVFILREYNFNIVHMVSKVNHDANSLS